MTAEIAILNKSAVALATDSAVTISSGSSSHKVFDSADELFELSCSQPIGVMIYNGMQFSGVPLQDLIKDFRSQNQNFSTVVEAANQLLRFLNEEGLHAPKHERDQQVISIAAPYILKISGILDRAVKDKLTDFDIEKDASFDDFVRKTCGEILTPLETAADREDNASFYALNGDPSLSNEESQIIDQLAAKDPGLLDDATIQRLATLVKRLILKSPLSPNRTGLIVAGFGRDERFPSLVSFEFDGIIAGGLKFNKTSECDIDRGGPLAYIRPFAQKDMVERFLYGIDEKIGDYIFDKPSGLTYI